MITPYWSLNGSFTHRLIVGATLQPRFLSLLITSVPVGLLSLLLLAFLIFHTVMSCQGKTTKQFCKMMRGQCVSI